jgi:serine/threonine protein kinase
MLGTTISHYEVLQQIGFGAMGTVYRARDHKAGRDVALKVLAQARMLDPTHRQRLVREARAMALVEHPNIAAVYEIDERDGVAFIAMELLKGSSLTRVLGDGPLDTGRAFAVAADVLSALSAVHARGLLHRDLKPSNVFLDESGKARLIDFGLVKAIERANPELLDLAARTLTGPGMLVGTVAYMAPEQLRRTGSDVRSDIFSFGLVLFEMLTGHPPFDDRTLAATVRGITQLPTPRLPEATEGPEVSAERQRIVDRALAKDPADRYQEVGEMLRDVAALAARLPSSR